MKKTLLIGLLCTAVFGGGVKEDFIIHQNKDFNLFSHKLILKNGNSDVVLKNSGAILSILNNYDEQVIVSGIADGGRHALKKSTWANNTKGQYDAVNAGQIYTMQTNLEALINEASSLCIAKGVSDGKNLDKKLYFNVGSNPNNTYINYYDGLNISSESNIKLKPGSEDAVIIGGNNTIKDVKTIVGKTSRGALTIEDNNGLVFDASSGNIVAICGGEVSNMNGFIIRPPLGSIEEARLRSPYNDFRIVTENSKTLYLESGSGNINCSGGNLSSVKLLTASGKITGGSLKIGNVTIGTDGKITGVAPATLPQ